MKNSILTVLLASLCSISSHAEAWFKTEVGIGAWSHDIEIADATPGEDIAQNFHFELRQYLYYFLPHVSFDYSSIDAAHAGFNEMDLSFFYHAIKNDRMFLNLGVSYNYFDSGYFITNQYEEFNTGIVDFFAQSQVIIPRTNFSIGGKLDFSGAGANSVSGYTAELRYRIIMNRLLISVKGGYRKSTNTFQLGNNTKDAKITLTGPFLGASVTL